MQGSSRAAAATSRDAFTGALAAGADRSRLAEELFAVVGVFDGIHRGHEYLLGELRRVAAAHDARPAVITFDHHPDEILQGAAPPLLCDPQERLDRLAAAGVAVTVIETFDRALRETTYDAWVGRIADRVELAGLLMTPESAFGYERGGTPETVAQLGRSLGYEVVVVPQFTLDGETVRSSASSGSRLSRTSAKSPASFSRKGRAWPPSGTVRAAARSTSTTTSAASTSTASSRSHVAEALHLLIASRPNHAAGICVPRQHYRLGHTLERSIERRHVVISGLLLCRLRLPARRMPGNGLGCTHLEDATHFMRLPQLLIGLARRGTRDAECAPFRAADG